MAIPALFLCLLTFSCCLPADPLLDIPAVYDDVLRFSTLPQGSSNNELLASLWGVYARSERFDFGHLNIRGWPVCDECFQRLFSVSESTWKRRRADVRSGLVYWEHGNAAHEAYYSTKGYLSRAWMHKWFCALGDYQPDTSQVHLPPMDKKDIWAEMHSELGQDCVSTQYFYKVWAHDFPDHLIPGDQRVGKCKECADLHERIVDEKDFKRRMQHKLERTLHVRFVRRERLVYHRLRQRCRQSPGESILIILDGMDQNKTNLPTFHCGDHPRQVSARIIGAIVHGATKKMYAYVVTHFTKESNTMMEVLSRVLDDQDTLPPHLIIQLDNTSQDNKNVKIFSFLATLVETGQFESVTVNFLPVGHTHVRMDLLFLLLLTLFLFLDWFELLFKVFMCISLVFVRRKTSTRCSP